MKWKCEACGLPACEFKAVREPGLDTKMFALNCPFPGYKPNWRTVEEPQAKVVFCQPGSATVEDIRPKLEQPEPDRDAAIRLLTLEAKRMNDDIRHLEKLDHAGSELIAALNNKIDAVQKRVDELGELFVAAGAIDDALLNRIKALEKQPVRWIESPLKPGSGRADYPCGIIYTSCGPFCSAVMGGQP